MLKPIGIRISFGLVLLAALGLLVFWQTSNPGSPAQAAQIQSPASAAAQVLLPPARVAAGGDDVTAEQAAAAIAEAQALLNSLASVAAAASDEEASELLEDLLDVGWTLEDANSRYLDGDYDEALDDALEALEDLSEAN